MKKLIKFSSVLLMTLFMLSCSSDDSNDEPNIAFSVEQLHGTWKVNYFWDQTDRTAEYEDYLFTFDNFEGDITVLVDGETKFGSFRLYEDNVNGTVSWILDMDFDTSDPGNTGLTELIEKWVVKFVNNSGTNIEFEELESNNTPEILELEKITD